MLSASPRAFPLLWIAAATLCVAPTASAQQMPAQPSVQPSTTLPSTSPPSTQPSPTTPSAAPQPTLAQTAALQVEGTQALDFLLKHEVMDPNAIIPGTGKPISPHGTWSIGKQRPTSCPPPVGSVAAPCVRILYSVPDTPVSCEWVVLLKPDGINATILEQNSDSIRYMLRIVPAAEAAPMVVARQTELNSRSSPRLTGVVEVGLIISTTGEPNRIFPVSGPETLRPAAIAIAKQWIFRPLTIGSRPIPYETIIKFIFGNGQVKTEP